MGEESDSERPKHGNGSEVRRVSALESFLKFLTEALAFGTRGAPRRQKARVVGGIVYVGLAALALVTVAVHAAPLAIAGAWGVLILAALLGVVFHVAGPLYPAVSNALVAAIVLALIAGLAFLGAGLFSQLNPHTTELRLRGTVVDNEDVPIANATVSAIGSAESSVTSVNGRFDFTIDGALIKRDSLTLGVRVEKQAATFRLPANGSPFLITLRSGGPSDPSKLADKPELNVRLLGEHDYGVASPLDPYYVVPMGQSAEWKRSLAAALRLNSHDKWEEWARAHGGVHGSPQFVRIELRALTDEPVIIHGLRVHVVRRSPPLRGVFAASAMCGYESVRIASVDLDSNPPVVEYAANDESEWQSHLTLSVSRTEVEVIELQTGTSGYAEWYFEVLYSGPSGTGHITVDDHGSPFRVSSEVGSTAYHWHGDEIRREPDWDKGISVC